MKATMKIQLSSIAVLMASLMIPSFSSCSNGAKEKYEAQKVYVDSMQTANKQAINGATVLSSPTEVLIIKLDCYHAEVEALDSLKNLAKEAFGDNSAEYKEAYDRKIKAQEAADEATNESLHSLRNTVQGY